MDLRYEQPQGSQVAVLVVDGEVDITTVAQLRQALLDPPGQAQYVVVDLTAVAFLDSTALGMIVGAMKRATANGGGLALAAVPDGRVARTFQVTGLSKVFPIYATAAEAVAGLEASAG